MNLLAGAVFRHLPQPHHAFRIGKRHPCRAFVLEHAQDEAHGADDQTQRDQDNHGAARSLEQRSQGKLKVVHGR